MLGLYKTEMDKIMNVWWKGSSEASVQYIMQLLQHEIFLWISNLEKCELEKYAIKERKGKVLNVILALLSIALLFSADCEILLKSKNILDKNWYLLRNFMLLKI